MTGQWKKQNYHLLEISINTIASLRVRRSLVSLQNFFFVKLERSSFGSIFSDKLERSSIGSVSALHNNYWLSMGIQPYRYSFSSLPLKQARHKIVFAEEHTSLLLWSILYFIAFVLDAIFMWEKIAPTNCSGVLENGFRL